MTERFGWYETRVEEAAARYERVAAERINEWLLDLLPKPPALVLDGCTQPRPTGNELCRIVDGAAGWASASFQLRPGRPKHGISDTLLEMDSRLPG